MQREKLGASGLSDHFKVVVVSADIGVGKPDPSVFREALAKLGADEDTVMVGDSIEKDVKGARAARLQAVWVNRARRPKPDDLSNPRMVSTLSELPTALASLH